MPWNVKRVFVLIVLGFIAAVCAIAVLVRNRSADTNLLAIIGLVGALAMVIVSLPENGHGD